MLKYADLREDKQFFMDHPGAVPITTAQVRNAIDFLSLSFLSVVGEVGVPDSEILIWPLIICFHFG